MSIGRRLFIALLALAAAACTFAPVEDNTDAWHTVTAGWDPAGGCHILSSSAGAGPTRAWPHAMVVVTYLHETYYDRRGFPTQRNTLESLVSHGRLIGPDDPRYQQLEARAFDDLLRSDVLTSGELQRLQARRITHTRGPYWLGWLRFVLLPLGVVVGVIFMPWRWVFVDGPLALAALAIREPDPTICESCAYSMAGLPTRTCPECGHQNQPVVALP